MTESVEIDWEAKFHQQVSENIRHKATASAKLQDVHLALDKANTEIDHLVAEIKRLTPAGDKMKAMQSQLEQSDRQWSNRCKELVKERDDLRAARGRGQRAVLESVVELLDTYASRLPVPLDEERIKLS